MAQIKVIGYYICEVIDVPKGLFGSAGRGDAADPEHTGENIRKFLSVSNCLGEQHPYRECLMETSLRLEEGEYQAMLKLDDAAYRALNETGRRLFDTKRIDVDRRFLYLSDAMELCETYFSALPCVVVSISTTTNYFGLLASELGRSAAAHTLPDGKVIPGCCHGLMNGEVISVSSRDPMRGAPAGGVWIGNDILGWDIAFPHALLCNGLQDELPTSRFNQLGLLKNDFEETVRFAAQIQGMGEPVEWIPCMLHAYGRRGRDLRRTFRL